MTYGWAIMATVMALGVLAYFGVFTPGKYVSSNAVVSPPFYINAWDIQETGITLELKNNGGEKYRIQSIDIENCGINNNLVIISTSGLETMIVPCDLSNYTNFKGDITIKYRKLSNNSVDLTSTGTITGRVGKSGISNCTYGPWIDRECGLNNCTTGEMYQNQSILSGTGCVEVNRCVANETCCNYNPWTDQGCGLGNCTAGEMYQNRTAINGSAFCTATEICTPSSTCGSIPLSTCTQLQNISNNLTKDYFLINDINCSETITWNNKSGFEPIGASSNPFEGKLEGFGFEISDLYINRPGTNDVGLFSYISNTAIINKVGLTNVNITGDSTLGSLIANNLGAIDNCYSTGSVNGNERSGGLIGSNLGTISNSYSTASVSSSISSAGGLVGTSKGTSIITTSYATGNVNGILDVGGFIGMNSGNITDCYATGNVTGFSTMGGFAGSNAGGEIISNSFYNNHTGNPDICVGTGGTVDCTAIPNNEPYFYDVENPGNPPMTNWSFPPWSSANDDVDFPILA